MKKSKFGTVLNVRSFPKDYKRALDLNFIDELFMRHASWMSSRLQSMIDNDEREHSQRQSITYLVLFPLAFLQSRFYWVYSVLLCLCHLSSSSSPPQSLLNDPVTSVQDGARRRLRALSEPPPMPGDCLVDAATSLRPRSTTIHTTVAKHNQAGSERPSVVRPTTVDEVYGVTCPPQWWQKTRRILARRPPRSSPPSSPSLAPLEAERDPEATKVRSMLLLKNMFHKERAGNKSNRVFATLAKLQRTRPHMDEDDTDSIASNPMGSLKKRGLWKRRKTSVTHTLP